MPLPPRRVPLQCIATEWLSCTLELGIPACVSFILMANVHTSRLTGLGCAGASRCGAGLGRHSWAAQFVPPAPLLPGHAAVQLRLARAALSEVFLNALLREVRLL